MRLGFILGFLVGAGIAAFYTLAEEAEAPAVVDTEPRSAPRQLLQKVKTQAREAKEAGAAAAREKEEAMRRAYEDAVRRQERA